MNKKYYIYYGFREHVKLESGSEILSPFENYYLTDNAGEFFGEYPNSGFSKCHVIGRVYINHETSVNEKGNEVTTFTRNMSLCDYATTKEEPIPDTFTSPIEFEAQSDEEAFNYFNEYVSSL